MKIPFLIAVFFVLVALPTVAVAQSCTMGPSQLPHNAVLTWNWTQGPNTPPATGFNIKRSTTQGSGYVVIGTLTGTTTKTYVDMASSTNVLVEGQTYFYVITAVGTGGESGNSNEVGCVVPFSVPPSAPTGASATIH